MNAPVVHNNRVDRLLRILITFFFRETLDSKERRMVVCIVRLASSAVVTIAAMIVTLMTESIFDFFWFILGCILLYAFAKIAGFVRKRRKRNA